MASRDDNNSKKSELDRREEVVIYASLRIARATSPSQLQIGRTTIEHMSQRERNKQDAGQKELYASFSLAVSRRLELFKPK
jgi:hypothetical protein